MDLSPTELERLTIFTAAELARRYRSQGIRLSYPEAVALISDEVMAAARRGLSHPDLVTYGGTLLTADDVVPGVAGMIRVISVEVAMAEGTKLVTIFRPIGPGTKVEEEHVRAGEIITPDGEIEIKKNSKLLSKERRKLGVTATAVVEGKLTYGDREIDVWGVVGKLDDHWRLLYLN